ncbi:hypothetical protein B0A50_06879 [Salinomyces thailandicus]|uniref:Uncharacterized protein n=1 Tax=Salinomyces thailandicus TaxID=706561 RepID=A0A4V5N3L5_9PEZI|nr:hypothetical protein B0A50_06879 [Salinomyces thailandica]
MPAWFSLYPGPPPVWPYSGDAAYAPYKQPSPLPPLADPTPAPLPPASNARGLAPEWPQQVWDANPSAIGHDNKHYACLYANWLHLNQHRPHCQKTIRDNDRQRLRDVAHRGFSWQADPETWGCGPHGPEGYPGTILAAGGLYEYLAHGAAKYGDWTFWAELCGLAGWDLRPPQLPTPLLPAVSSQQLQQQQQQQQGLGFVGNGSIQGLAQGFAVQRFAPGSTTQSFVPESGRFSIPYQQDRGSAHVTRLNCCAQPAVGLEQQQPPPTPNGFGYGEQVSRPYGQQSPAAVAPPAGSFCFPAVTNGSTVGTGGGVAQPNGKGAHPEFASPLPPPPAQEHASGRVAAGFDEEDFDIDWDALGVDYDAILREVELELGLVVGR